MLLLFALLVWVEYNTPKPVDWRRTYSGEDKIPFGCNAFYRLLDEDLYKGNAVIKNETPYNVVNENEKTVAYLFIGGNLTFSRLDSRRLLEFVKEGNTVMIASAQLTGLLADTFHIEEAYDYKLYVDTMLKPSFNFCSAFMKAKKPYTYPRSMDISYYKSFDTSRVKMLAATPDSNAVFVSAALEKGKIYFFSLPDVFSNYFVVNEYNREAAYKVISYAGGATLWWDEYYKGYKEKTDHPLQFIFNHDALYAAYCLSLVSLIIFMVFALKRRQKAVPVIEPLKNTILQFTEVIGSVYYNAKNHKIIAQEKINSFTEFIRSRFSVNVHPLTMQGPHLAKVTEADIERIAALSLISTDSINKLLRFIQYISSQPSITENELVELNTLIEHFYKHNKR